MLKTSQNPSLYPVIDSSLERALSGEKQDTPRSGLGALALEQARAQSPEQLNIVNEILLQAPAALDDYNDICSNAGINSRFELPAFQDKLKAWLTQEKIDYMLSQKKSIDMQEYTLVATPRLSAGHARTLIKTVNMFCDNGTSPSETTMNSIRKANSPEQLAATREAGQGHFDMNFVLIPSSEFMYFGQDAEVATRDSAMDFIEKTDVLDGINILEALVFMQRNPTNGRGATTFNSNSSNKSHYVLKNSRFEMQVTEIADGIRAYPTLGVR